VSAAPVEDPFAPPPSAAPRACAICGAALAGPYCHACGQASPAAARGFRDVLSGQTGRLLHTLRLLLTRPGELAREIDEGRDRRAVRPLTLLLNLIALFFLVGGGQGGFGAHTMIANDRSGTITAIVAERAQHRGIAQPLFEERLEQRFKSVYSLLGVVQALAYGCAFWLVERRRRKAPLVHFAAAIHYMCFSFLASTVEFGILKLKGVEALDVVWLVWLTWAVVATYMALALRRTYRDSMPLAAGKTLIVMSIGFVVSVILSFGALVVALVTI